MFRLLKLKFRTAKIRESSEILKNPEYSDLILSLEVFLHKLKKFDRGFIELKNTHIYEKAILIASFFSKCAFKNLNNKEVEALAKVLNKWTEYYCPSILKSSNTVYNFNLNNKEELNDAYFSSRFDIFYRWLDINGIDYSDYQTSKIIDYLTFIHFFKPCYSFFNFDAKYPRFYEINELDELNINYDFENFEIMRKHFIYSIEQIFISQSLVNKIISEIKYNLSEFEWMDE